MTRFSGDRLPNVSGDRLPNISGDRLPNISGDRLPNISGDRLPNVSGDRLPKSSNALNNSGFSIVVVMALLTGIISLALAAGQTATSRRKQSGFYAERIRARHAALSGIDAGKYLLQIDRTPWDGPGDTWTEQLEFNLNATQVTVTIADEEAGISLRHLVLPSGDLNTPLIAAMVSLLPGNPDIGNRWQTFLRIRQNTHGHRPVTHNILTYLLDDNVSGGSSKLYSADRLETMFSAVGSGRINVNTASPELLRALGGPGLEHAVAQQRDRAPLTSIFEIPDAANLLQGLVSVVDIKSSFFTITSQASSPFVTCRVEAVIWRRDTELTVLRHKTWWS